MVVWFWTGECKPYYTTQYFGFAACVHLVMGLPSKYSGTEFWAVGCVMYIFAKVLEEKDVWVWEKTGKVVSGHTLKHLVVAYGGHLICLMLVNREALPIDKPSEVQLWTGNMILGMICTLGVGWLAALSTGPSRMSENTSSSSVMDKNQQTNEGMDYEYSVEHTAAAITVQRCFRQISNRKCNQFLCSSDKCEKAT